LPNPRLPDGRPMMALIGMRSMSRLWGGAAVARANLWFFLKALHLPRAAPCHVPGGEWQPSLAAP